MKNVEKQKIQNIKEIVTSEKGLTKSELKQLKGGSIVEENAEGF